MRGFLKVGLIGILCLSLIILISGCNSTEQTKAGNDDVNKVIEIKFSSTMPEVEFTSHPAAKAIKSFIDNVEERSQGKVKITLYPGGQLSSNVETDVVGMKNGSFQMCNPSMGSLGAYTKAFMPFNMVYLFKNQAAVDKFLDSEIGQRMREDALKDTNIRILAYLDNGFRNVTNSKHEIKSPDDMKGLKIRTMEDPFQIKAMGALGASPTPLAYSELFSALQQGVVDGQENPLSNIYQAKFYEVQDYLTLTKHSYTVINMCISNQFFESLPEDIQKIMLEEARNAELLSRENSAESEKSLLAELTTKMTVYELDDTEFAAFQEKAKSSWSLVKNEIGEDYYNQIIDTANKFNAEVQ